METILETMSGGSILNAFAIISFVAYLAEILCETSK